jgi:hypothetical protein
VTAKYHPEIGKLAILLRMDDGTVRSGVIMRESVVYNGHKIDKEEMDKQMERTADMFRRAAGRKIKTEMFEGQVDIGDSK